MEMLITGLLSILYGIVISFGYGKRLDDNIVTRPIIVIGGVLIVLGGYAWGARDLDAFWELLKWFAAGGLPMILRSGLIFVRQQEATEKAQEQEQEMIERHAIGD